MTIQFSIYTPEKTLFKGNVKRVSLPGKLGPFSILPLHAPLVSTLVAGDVIYEAEEGTFTQAIQGGLVTVEENNVRVFLQKG